MKTEPSIYDIDGNLLKDLKMSINKSDPCTVKGGWFYVNHSSIEFVTPGGDMGRITKKQLEAVIAIMERTAARPTSKGTMNLAIKREMKARRPVSSGC